MEEISASGSESPASSASGTRATRTILTDAAILVALTRGLDQRIRRLIRRQLRAARRASELNEAIVEAQAIRTRLNVVVANPQLLGGVATLETGHMRGERIEYLSEAIQTILATVAELYNDSGLMARHRRAADRREARFQPYPPQPNDSASTEDQPRFRLRHRSPHQHPADSSSNQ